LELSGCEAVRSNDWFGVNTKQKDRAMNEKEKAAMDAGVLIAFWGALWGSFGTEYARGFIEAQLRGMEPDKRHEIYTEPTMQ
jgi:hypothetical protein